MSRIMLNKDCTIYYSQYIVQYIQVYEILRQLLDKKIHLLDTCVDIIKIRN